VTYTLSSSGTSVVENLTLTGNSAINGTGNALDNVITGNGLNNSLNGGAGADTLIGGAGNDTYTVDNQGDSIVELAGEGSDSVTASVSYWLSDNVENLTLASSAGSIDGEGNDLANTITGNSGDNHLWGWAGDDTLDGGSAGNDTLEGGEGNDTYVVSRAGIAIVENAGGGIDKVNASITYTLVGTEIENLTLTNTGAVNGTGNSLNNVLIGNSGTNVLTGGAGNDILDPGSNGNTDMLSGGLGDDTYNIGTRTMGFSISESAGEGFDSVNSSAAYNLASNVEALFLQGTMTINGTGNTIGNLLRGNSVNNTLNGGGGGIDVLEGGSGGDTLQGTSANSLFNGGADNDFLNGSAARDLLIGGLGNDTLTTGSGADLILFNKGDGQDTVAASTGKDNVLSLGNGIAYADLLFQKTGSNLILKIGASDQITFTGYYNAVTPNNRSVDQLQVILNGSPDYNPGSSDPTRNREVERFNFDGLVAAFDSARASDPSITTWALTNALTAQYVAGSGSDTAAIGGDLAYRYGRFGTLSDISYAPAAAILGASTFATAAQALQTLTSLQDSTPRLS
jgi:Ca2+-binding RTX toxin-like protein